MTKAELQQMVAEAVASGIKAHMAAQAQAGADPAGGAPDPGAGAAPDAEQKAREEAERRRLAEQSAQLRTMVQQILREQTDPHVRRDPDLGKGIAVARLVRFLAANKGRKEETLKDLRKAYGEDDMSVKALLASNHESGGVLIAPEFAADLIEFLRPSSVFRSLNPNVVPMNAGHMSWPKQTAGAAGSYIGEVKRAPKTQLATGGLNLSAKKLAAILPLSNDLLRWSSINADNMVRNELSVVLNLRADIAFIRGSGGENVPRGLRNWAPAANLLSFAAQGTNPTVDNITDALEDLRLRLRASDVMFVRPGWLMSPRTEAVLRRQRSSDSVFIWREEMNRGMLEGYPYRVTTQIPENLNVGGSGDDTELYLADFNDVIIGEAEQLMIEASSEAAYFDGAEVRAAFATDETVIRAIMLHDMGMRHAESVAIGTGIRWAS